MYKKNVSHLSKPKVVSAPNGVCKPMTTSGSGINEYWKSVDILLLNWLWCTRNGFIRRVPCTFNILAHLSPTTTTTTTVIYVRSFCSSNSNQCFFRPSIPEGYRTFSMGYAIEVISEGKGWILNMHFFGWVLPPPPPPTPVTPLK